MPSFQLNLLSASKVTKSSNCCVILFPDFCVLQDLATGKMIGRGKQSGGLYYMSPVHTSLTVCHTSNPDTTWHHRLGHPSPACLRLISKSNKFIYTPFDNFCNVCPLAKQTRLPFPLSSISSTLPFQLIHCDIWGPHKHPTHSGARYFLTIVDDFTRCTWLFLMSHKSDAPTFLKSFYIFVQNQFNSQIKFFHSDNGSEFISPHSFFTTKGVEFQSSCVSTPQQNGVVERKHHHILQVARALLFQSNMPIRFWGECVSTAVYLINRLPNQLLSHISPFERLYGRPPTHVHLRVFGCLCYATVVKPFSKFAPRAKCCVFLGYPTGQKGYKLLDLDSHKIFVNRDVRFYEHIFPYKKTSSPNFIPVPAPDLSYTPSLPHTIDPLAQDIPIPTTPTTPLASPDLPTPTTLPDPSRASLPTSTPTSPSPIAPRHSTRPRAPPAWHADYQMNFAHIASPPLSSPTSCPTRGTRHPLSNSLSYSRISPTHYSFLPLYLVSVSPLTMIRQFLTRNGGMLCKLNLMPLLAIILGLLFPSLPVTNPLAANGSMISNTTLMVLLNVTRLATLLRAILKLKELIIWRLSLPLPNLLLCVVSWRWLHPAIGSSIKWTFIMPFYKAILMRLSIWIFPLVFADRGRIWYVGSINHYMV